MIDQLVHIWKFKDDGDRRAHCGRVREQGFRRGVRFEVSKKVLDLFLAPVSKKVLGLFWPPPLAPT
jgi:hypothetical protein